MISSSLDFALEYLDRGWPVIPIKGKTPAVSWAAYQKGRPATEDPCLRSHLVGAEYGCIAPWLRLKDV